jgi:hypothetical protein
MAAESFYSKWLDWMPERKRSVDAPLLSTDKTDRSAFVSSVSAEQEHLGEKKSGRRTDYETIATSPLVARVRAAWPWLAEHRPDLYQAVRHADENGNVESLRSALEAAARAYERRQRAEAVRIFSKVLGTELWVATDETVAAGLRRDGVTLPVLLPDEAMILARMAEKDAREIFAVLVRVQRVMPGSRLREGDRGSDS